LQFAAVGRNKPVRALARTGVSGDHRANVPETPPRATPFGKALDRLGWSYSGYDWSGLFNGTFVF